MMMGFEDPIIRIPQKIQKLQLCSILTAFNMLPQSKKKKENNKKLNQHIVWKLKELIFTISILSF